MTVELKHYTPLSIADDAIGKCWDKPSNGECNIKRIHRVANQAKHASTIEHLSYNFDIDGISRALLQELARHRVSSFSVKSSRYTLGELKESKLDGSIDFRKFVVMTDNNEVNESIMKQLKILKDMVDAGIQNDIAKYCMPEAYKTSLVWTINARSLQNFLKLRTDKRALWEIRELAYEIFKQLPEDHKFLFEELLYDENNIEVYEIKKELYEVTINDRERYYTANGQMVDDDTIRKWLSR